MAIFKVFIDMEQYTVEQLTSAGYNLYGFKAVKAVGSGQPTVWFKTTDFSLSTALAWEDRYKAYTSRGQVAGNTQIQASASYDIQPGQTLNVNSSAGTGAVDTSSGIPGAVCVNNATTRQFTCGISQQQPGGTFAPICAFPLLANTMEAMVPLERIFLKFTTDPVDTGTVIIQSFSAGILIDLVDVSERRVSFDIRKGWSWEGSAPWARVYPADSTLTSLLDVGSGSLQQQSLRASSVPPPGSLPQPG